MAASNVSPRTTALRVNVIGSSASIPRPGRACSAYLVRSGETNVLLDLGSGALGNLRSVLDHRRLDAIVISHMHADHFFDLIPLRYALRYAPGSAAKRTPVWLPPGGIRALRIIASAFPPEGPGDFFDEVFELREYDPEQELRLAELTLRFSPGCHYLDSYAVRVEGEHGSMCYSGDTAPCSDVVELARGCDLFVCECTLGLGNEGGPMRGHLNAYEAGDMARQAQTRRLVLTHYGSEWCPDSLEEAAASHFDGACAIADDGIELRV